MNYEQATKHPMDWIYSQVIEDRDDLSHEFVLISDVEGGAQGTFASFTSIGWRFGQNQIILGYANEMVKAVKDVANRDYPEKMLLDLKRKLGVVIAEDGEYDPLEDVIIINPVGEPWPEESAKRGIECYHPVGGLTEDQLAPNWTDSRGSFLLQAGMQWTAKYYLYVKVS